MNSDIIPYCIAAYPTILFVYLFVIHPRAVAKTIGHSAKAWDISPKTEDKIDKWLFTITHYGILGTIWAQAMFGTNYGHLDLRLLTGAVVAALGGIFCVKAQLDMSNSWRMGVIASKDIPLITNGLFRFSRNPFYVGLLFVFWGLAITTSSIIVYGISITQTVLVHRQVLKEERALISSLDKEYEHYKKVTKRYF